MADTAMLDVVELLRWTGGDVEKVHAEYVDLLADSLGTFLRDLLRRAPVQAAVLTELVSEASTTAFDRVLTAPETSFRLLGTGGEDAAEVARFLTAAFRAEAAVDGTDEPVTGWTALGDIQVRHGTLAQRLAVGHGLAIDFASPHNVKLDLCGYVSERSSRRSTLTPQEVAIMLPRLEAAVAGIRRASPPSWRFISTFVRVVLLIKDRFADRPDTGVRALESGTNPHYIGRVFFVNAHSPGVDPVDVADALVHEAIHCLLYEREVFSPWFTDPALYSDKVVAVSPWSGRVLPLRSLLQAAFVWYGLFHFWNAALAAGAFDPELAARRRAVARTGFGKATLIDQVKQWRNGIPAELWAQIQAMQEELLSPS